VSSFDDHAQSTKGGDKQYDYENNGNSASEYRVHDRQVIKSSSSVSEAVRLIRRNGS
jgi:hypothetical protein